MGGRGASSGYISAEQLNLGFDQDKLRLLIEQSQNAEIELKQVNQPIAFGACKCCGLYTIPIESDYSTCRVCGWIDDPFQNTHPDEPNGRNEKSLHEAKKQFFENHLKQS
nr:CPCC family cysteine-rich protein [uncultured Sphaerochaeta sp.]